MSSGDFVRCCSEGRYDAVKQALGKGVLTKDIHTGLAQACQNGQTKVVEVLLQAKKYLPFSTRDTKELETPYICNIKTSYSGKKSPLLVLASWENHVEVVNLLLQYGGDCENCDNEGNTPLMAASAKGYHHIAVRLLFYCRNPNYLNKQNNKGFTALYYAAHLGQKNMILELVTPQSIYIKSKSSLTPLMIACIEGHNSIVQILLNYVVSPDECVDEDGNTPLLLACQKGRVDIVKILLNAGSDKTKENSNRNSPMMIACKKNNTDVFNVLFKYGAYVMQKRDAEGMTILMVVAKNGNTTMAQTLLNEVQHIPNGYLNWADKAGNTALMHACQKGHHETADILIGKGADVNKCNESKDTPLIQSCLHGYKAIVESLVRKGAQIELSNKSGFTALMTASKKGWYEITQVLTEAGANATAKDLKGDSAISMAKTDRMLRLLQKKKSVPALPGDKVPPNKKVEFEEPLIQVPYLSDLPSGYVIRCGTEFGSVLLPKENKLKVSVDKIPDKLYPHLEENEELSTRAVEVTPEGLHFDLSHPCIIAFPFDNASEQDPEKGTFDLFCGEFNAYNEIEWNLIDPKLSNVLVDDETISVSIYKSGIFAVKYSADPEVSFSPYQSQVPDGYTIEYETEFCCLVLPEDNHFAIQVEELSENLYPDLKENESLCTGAVVLKPDDVSFDSDRPCVIILPLDSTWTSEDQNKKFTPIYGHVSGSSSVTWRPIDPSLSNCTVGDENVSISVYHTGTFAVKCSTEYPATTTHINPNEESTLSVPELKNFQLEITGSSIEKSEKDVEIKSTIHFCDDSYNASEVCAAATSCVKFEPHGQRFKRPVQVTVPIPDYYKIIAEYPDIKINVWCSQNSTNRKLNEVPQNWRMLHGSDIIIEDGADSEGHPCKVAKFEIEHFSWYQCVFDKVKTSFRKLKVGANYVYNQTFRKPKTLHVKMKAIMSQPMEDREFGMIVALYRFGDPLVSEQTRYPYHLAHVEEIQLSEGSFQVSLKGNRFKDEDIDEVNREGILELFAGKNVCQRFEYILKLRPNCSLPLRNSQILGCVKLMQKEKSGIKYTLMVEQERSSSPDNEFSPSPAHNVQAKRFSFKDCERALEENFRKLLQQFDLESEKLEKSSPTEEQLRKLSKQQGSEWEECATALKIATNDIDDIKSNHEKNVKEQRYRALLHWKEKNGFKASHAVLVKGFISVARIDLAECICELFCE